MQALPYATQLLGRLGAEVIKVEAPGTGDLGRSAMPAMLDPEGRSTGATFMRNNLSKRSVVIDLKQPAGRDLVLRLAPRFDVVAENFRSGAAERLGLAYDDIAAVHDRVVYLSISGFGRPVQPGTATSPYDGWPALAAIVEAMSGAYEFKRPEGQPPIGAPMGGLGDIVTALFAVIGTLAALRQRDRTGRPQRIDVAMLDAMVAVVDVVPNFWSMGAPMGDALARHPPRVPRAPTAGSCSRSCAHISGPTSPGPSANRSGSTTHGSPRRRVGSSTSSRTSGRPSSRGRPTRPSAAPAKR